MLNKAPTKEEWLEALLRESARSDEGFTAAEWANKMHLSVRVTLERLKLAHSKGWVKVGWRTTIRLDGRQHQTPVYMVVRKKK